MYRNTLRVTATYLIISSHVPIFTERGFFFKKFTESYVWSRWVYSWTTTNWQISQRRYVLEILHAAGAGTFGRLYRQTFLSIADIGLSWHKTALCRFIQTPDTFHLRRSSAAIPTTSTYITHINGDGRCTVQQLPVREWTMIEYTAVCVMWSWNTHLVTSINEGVIVARTVNFKPSIVTCYY